MQRGRRSFAYIFLPGLAFLELKVGSTDRPFEIMKTFVS
jgi:hypothetical protein